MKHLTADQRSALAQRLATMHDETLQELPELASRSDADAEPQPREVHDFADDAEVQREEELVSAEIENDRRRLQDIEHARERMALGSYGFCEACGDELPAERLLAQPTAVRCIACQRASEHAR